MVLGAAERVNVFRGGGWCYGIGEESDHEEDDCLRRAVGAAGRHGHG